MFFFLPLSFFISIPCRIRTLFFKSKSSTLRSSSISDEENWNVLQLKSTVPSLSESRHKTFCKLQLISTLWKSDFSTPDTLNDATSNISNNNNDSRWIWGVWEWERDERETSKRTKKKILLNFTMKLFMPINNVVRPENGFSWSIRCFFCCCCWPNWLLVESSYTTTAAKLEG